MVPNIACFFSCCCVEPYNCGCPSKFFVKALKEVSKDFLLINIKSLACVLFELPQILYVVFEIINSCLYKLISSSLIVASSCSSNQ